MEKRFRIAESKMIPENTLILVSTMTMDKIKTCHSMVEVFKLLLEKENLIVVENRNWFNN
jgi:hypothetical protein